MYIACALDAAFKDDPYPCMVFNQIWILNLPQREQCPKLRQIHFEYDYHGKTTSYAAN